MAKMETPVKVGRPKREAARPVSGTLAAQRSYLMTLAADPNVTERTELRPGTPWPDWTVRGERPSGGVADQVLAAIFQRLGITKGSGMYEAVEAAVRPAYDALENAGHG